MLGLPKLKPLGFGVYRLGSWGLFMDLARGRSKIPALGLFGP